MPPGKDNALAALRMGLAPRAVAVYGASARRLTSQGARIADHLIKNSHAGRVALVNPNRQEVHGVWTVPSARESDLAPDLDLAVISVPRDSVIDAVNDCADAGIKLAIVTSAGFAEADSRGEDEQRALVKLASERDVRLIGPNCMGLINFGQGLYATGRQLPARPGRVSVVAQSGFLSLRLLDYLAQAGQGISLWATVGNCADLGPTELLEYAAIEASSAVVILYLENIGDPDRVRESIKAARRHGTDVVLVKSGRTTAGSIVAASHTGALAAPDVFVDVLADEADCIRVDTLREAAQVAAILASVGRPSGPFVVAAGSGGDCVLAGDACSFNEIPLASLSPETVEAVRRLVPQAASANPMDVSPYVSEGNLHNSVLATLASDPDVGAAVLPEAWGWSYRDTDDGGRELDLGPLRGPDGKLVLPIITSSSSMSPEAAEELVSVGMAVAPDSETVWSSLGHIVRHEHRRQLASSRDRAADAEGEAPGVAPNRLPELEALEMIRASGVPAVTTYPVADVEDLVQRCRELGYPVTIKGLVTGVVHKDDIGLVYTDVRTEQEVRTVWATLDPVVRESSGTVVVQPQFRRPIVEVLIATRDDPHYGLHLVVGRGGGGVEVASDVAWARCPVDKAQGRELLARTGVGELLSRKAPQALEPGGLPGLIEKVSRLAEESRSDVSEIEINPLLVSRDEVLAVDAVVTLR